MPVRAEGHALELDLELDRLGDVLDGELARQGEVSPWCPVIPVLVNVISGYFSASKKSPVRRWSSRPCWPVLTLAILMVAATLDWVGSSATVMLASNSPNWPRTLLTIMCLTTKPTRVCATSSV
jgi:hypothetical protein